MNTTVNNSGGPSQPLQWGAPESTAPAATPEGDEPSYLSAGAAVAVKAAEEIVEFAVRSPAGRAAASGLSRAASAWGSAAALNGGAVAAGATGATAGGVSVGEGVAAAGASTLGGVVAFGLASFAAIGHNFLDPNKAGDASEYAGTAPYPSPQQTPQQTPSEEKQTLTRWPANPNDDPHDPPDPNQRLGAPPRAPTQIKTSRTPDPDTARASTDSQAPGGAAGLGASKKTDWAEALLKKHGIKASDDPRDVKQSKAEAALEDIRREAAVRGISSDRLWPASARGLRDGLMLTNPFKLPYKGAYAAATNLTGTEEDRSLYIFWLVATAHKLGVPEKVDEWFETSPLSPPPELISEYFKLPFGRFMHWKKEAVVRVGFKTHVTATSENSKAVADIALPILRKYDVPHKVVSNSEIYRRKFDSPTNVQQGKFVTYYPQSVEQARAVSAELNRALRGMQGPPVKGEQPIGDSGMLWAQYANYGEDHFKHPIHGGPVVRVRGKEQSPSLVHMHFKELGDVGQSKAHEVDRTRICYLNQPGLTSDERAYGLMLYQQREKTPPDAVELARDERGKLMFDKDGFPVVDVKAAYKHFVEARSAEPASKADAARPAPFDDLDALIFVHVAFRYRGRLIGGEGMPRKDGFLDTSAIHRRILELPGGPERLREAIEKLPQHLRDGRQGR